MSPRLLGIETGAEELVLKSANEQFGQRGPTYVIEAKPMRPVIMMVLYILTVVVDVC